MKKIIIFLFCLTNSVFANSITSPLFIPKTREKLAIVEVGFNDGKYKLENNVSKIKSSDYEGWKGSIYGKVGLKNNLSLNYSVDYGFDRKIREMSIGNGFDNYSIGLSYRMIDNSNKFDIRANIGRATLTGANYAKILEINNLYNTDLTLKRSFVDFGLFYGFEKNFYNAMFGVTSKYYTKETNTNGNGYKKYADFIFSLENEFLLGSDFTIGLDLFYTIAGNNKIKFNNSNETLNNKNIYGLNVDINYFLNNRNYIGVYFKFNEEDSSFENNMKSHVYNYFYGVKLVALF